MDPTEDARTAVGGGASIIIPALDEEAGLPVTLDALAAVADQFDGPLEILVIDDGSRDGTAAIARDRGARVITHPKPAGYGAALKAGVRAASYDRVAIIDADATYPAERLPEFIAALATWDMVVGARTGPHYRRPGLLSPLRLIFLRLTEFVVGSHVPDPNSGLRAVRRDLALPLLPLLPSAFSFTTTITLIMTLHGRFIDYRPIDYRPRLGRRKLRVVRDSLRMAQTLVEVILRHNPLKLFLLLGLVPLALAPVLGALASAGLGTLVVALCLCTALVIFALGALSVARSPRPGPPPPR